MEKTEHPGSSRLLSARIRVVAKVMHKKKTIELTNLLCAAQGELCLIFGNLVSRLLLCCLLLHLGGKHEESWSSWTRTSLCVWTLLVLRPKEPWKHLEAAGVGPAPEMMDGKSRQG